MPLPSIKQVPGLQLTALLHECTASDVQRRQSW